MKPLIDHDNYLERTKAHYEEVPLDADDGSAEYGYAERIELEQKLFGRVLRRAGLNAHTRVVDVGGGGGRNSKLIQQLTGALPIVVDLSWTQVRSARRRALRAVQADALRLPFGDATFDCTVAYGCLHHTPSCHLGLAEAVRVTVPGGRVFWSVYNRHHPYFWIYHLLAPACRRSRLCQQLAFRLWFWPALWLFRSWQVRKIACVSQAYAWRFFGDQYLTPRATFHDSAEFWTLAGYLGLTIEELVIDHAGQMISVLARKAPAIAG